MREQPTSNVISWRTLNDEEQRHEAYSTAIPAGDRLEDDGFEHIGRLTRSGPGRTESPVQSQGAMPPGVLSVRSFSSHMATRRDYGRQPRYAMTWIVLRGSA